MRRPAQPLTKDEILDRQTQELIEAMRETMYDAPGVGLAAPQVGISLQLAVLEDRADLLQKMPPEQLALCERAPVPFTVVINPKLTPEDGETVEFFEGCLSVSGFAAIAPRFRRVRVECLNERAEPVVIRASGWHARILQHEIDHLNGILYIDRMNSRTFSNQDNFMRYWKEMPIAQVRHEIGSARE